MKKFILPLLLVIASTHQTLQADIYKWTDKDGKVHYSATPPIEPQKNIEDIEAKIKANIGKVQPETNYTAPKATDEEETSDSEKNNTSTPKTADPYEGDRSPGRIVYCNSLRNNIHTMESNKGAKIVKEGDTAPLSESQIADQLKKDKKSLATNCIDI